MTAKAKRARWGQSRTALRNTFESINISFGNIEEYPVDFSAPEAAADQSKINGQCSYRRIVREFESEAWEPLLIRDCTYPGNRLAYQGMISTVQHWKTMTNPR